MYHSPTYLKKVFSIPQKLNSAPFFLLLAATFLFQCSSKQPYNEDQTTSLNVKKASWSIIDTIDYTALNADIELAPNGTGHVTIKGNTNQGTLQLNCENNSHGQQIVAAPHSESANNVLTLPSTGGDARLVSTSSTATLTNKTLTTPVIAEIDSGSTITLDATTDIVLDAGGADVTLKDDGTTFGSLTNSSGELVIKSGSTPTTAMTFSGANVTFAGTVTIGSAGISEAELEILDGATVTTAELNILDGVTSTASEINIIDAGTMKQVALTDVKTYLSSAGFSTDDPTALAIALG